MNLAERLAAAKPATVPALLGQGVLIADIERIPGTFTGEFWNLNGFQHRRIRPEEVTEWPRTICWASRWYGEPDSLRFDAEWHRGGYPRMLRRIWKRLDRAQIVVGHNFDRFDRRHLHGAFIEAGLPAPSPYKVVDTLKVARAEFAFESNTLDALCRRFGIVAKSGRYSAAVARAASAGDPDAQAQIEAYNGGDIDATEALYDYLRPWIKNHPHNANGTGDDRPVCNRCWSSDMTRQGYVLASVIAYTGYRCSVCGGNLKTTAHHRAANTRGA